MGFFDKIKNAVGNRAGDEIAKKIDPNARNTGYTGSSSSSYEPIADPVHDAKVEAMRKENELRALEMERKMQDASLRMMNATADSMEQAGKTLEEQNRKNKK